MAAISKTPTVTDFKNNPDIYFEQAQATKEPVVVVAGNEAKFVVLNAAAYQAMLDRIELLDSVAGLYQAELDFAQGRSRPAREAFEELRQKLGVSRQSCGICPLRRAGRFPLSGTMPA